ncbi:WYL domain-containing protein [Salibaculum griseiflavum]|uniref:WYL domain-containing protein n=1 Tax=Salibaculum griseiflavum TaxID=1914409 RepID=A0A2V1P2W2_9RHOB|nr:WYL domain-containing protein [Salibaculum griseiflavum]PWG15652.1 WYL domain-containing protein [Salibaculum griseiflavum]
MARSHQTVRRKSNWTVEQRYQFIEFRLYWAGNINRSDIIDVFGISKQQASNDLANYIEGRKSNLSYDKRLRTYVRGKNFRPRFMEPDASDFFSQLQAVDQGLLQEDRSWVTPLPSYGSPPTPVRGVNPATLRDVVAAIRTSQGAHVLYQSFSRPEPNWRWIEPHSLAFDGFRWHARAFCLIDNVFKDFLLSRIIDIDGFDDSTTSIEDDHAWNSVVVLKIGPHPDLSDAQKHVIGLDYGMEDGVTQIKVRKAMLYYALKRLGLDTDPAARRPQDQQIVLLNRDEVLGTKESSV